MAGTKVYITMTVISTAFWSLILAYGIYKLLKNKSCTPKLKNYVRPQNSKDKIRIKYLDVAGMKNKEIVETTSVAETTSIRK